MKKDQYREYLASEAWQIRRKWKLEQADHRCQVCNSDEQLHVHHRTYDRLGNERENDLTVLCRDCHALFHHRMPDPAESDPEMSTLEAWRRAISGGLSLHPQDLDTLRRAHADYFSADNLLLLQFEYTPDEHAMRRDRRGSVARVAAYIQEATGRYVNVGVTSWIW